MASTHFRKGKTILLCLLSGVFIMGIRSESMTAQSVWAKCFFSDTDHRDFPHSICNLSNGRFLLAVDDLKSNWEHLGTLLMEIDQAGKILLQRKIRVFGGSNTYDAELGEVNPTSDGGLILAGDRQISNDVYNGWCLKLDSKGKALWGREFKGFSNILHSVCEAEDHGYYAVGWINPKNDGEFCSMDVLCLKLDSSGNIQWQKTYAGTKRDYGSDVCPLSDGGCLILGTTDSFGVGQSDTWLLRLKPDGQISWQTAYGSPKKDYGEKLRLSPSGDIIILGSTYSGKYSYWVLKLTAQGGIVFQKSFSPAIPHSLTVARNGDIILAGQFPVKDTDGKETSGWMMKLGKSGKTIWQKAYAGLEYQDVTENTWAESVCQAEDGGLAFLGCCSFYSTIFSENKDAPLILKLNANGNTPGIPYNARITITSVVPLTLKPNKATSKATSVNTNLTLTGLKPKIITTKIKYYDLD
jgi:hypothetical protein